MRKLVLAVFCLFSMVTAGYASQTVVSAPGVEIKGTSQPEVKKEVLPTNGAVVSTDNNDKTIILDQGSLLVSGSNNDIKIEGTVSTIRISGDNNDIQYPQQNAKVKIINSGSNNDIMKY